MITLNLSLKTIKLWENRLLVNLETISILLELMMEFYERRKVGLSSKMEFDTKVNGKLKVIPRTAEVNRFGLMVASMKVTGLRIWQTVKVD